MKRTMLYPIKPGCFRPRADGISNIHIQYCYTSKQRTLLDTEIQIPVSCWDKKELKIARNLPPEYGNVKDLNTRLTSQLKLVEDIIKYAERRNVPDKGKFVRNYYKPELDIYSLDELVKNDEQEKVVREIEKKKTELDVFHQIDLYIISKTKKVSKDMPRIYRNMKDHLLAYQAARQISLTFETFTLDFYEDFVDFLSHEYVQRRRKVPIVGLKINTVGKTVNQLRTFLINRAKRKIIAPIDLSDWDVVGEEVDAEYLNWEEIEMIWKLDLSRHSHFIPYRDEFVLGCLTGLRFSDFSVLESPDIRGEFLYKKQQKSIHRVVIPLRQAAKDILENRFKKDYEPLTNAEFNRHIKTICKLAGITDRVKHTYTKGNKKIDEIKPKCEWITTHTCRRSFCTNEFLAGSYFILIILQKNIIMSLTKSDIYKQLNDGQDKFAYFSLAVAASAIAYALQKTEGKCMTWSLIPLALAVLCWLYSFYLGCEWIKSKSHVLYLNFQLLEVHEGTYNLSGTDKVKQQIGVETLSDLMNNISEKAAKKLVKNIPFHLTQGMNSY